MKDGFIKLAVAVPPLRVGDCNFNTGELIRLASETAEIGAAITVFPELCITGYSCADLFYQSALLDSAELELRRFAEATSKFDTLYFIGVPVRLQGKLYNCCGVLHRGRLLGLIPKTVLLNNNGFYETRQFTKAPDKASVCDFAGMRCPIGTKLLFSHAKLSGLVIGAEIGFDLNCQNPPSVSHCESGASLICNISASPELVAGADYRRELTRMHSSRHICAYAYASAGPDESTTDSIFSGHSFLCEYGTLLAENPPFGGAELTLSEIDIKRLEYERRRNSSFICKPNPEYTYITFDTELRETQLTRVFPRMPFIPAELGEKDKRCKLIFDMQGAALQKRIKHTNSRTAVLGVSGGLDSTLALIAAALAFDKLRKPRSQILGITMPCFGTSPRTKKNAEALCRLLGVSYREIPITKAVAQHLKDIGHDGTTCDVTFENAQARERTQVLMDIANQTGGLVIGTGDLSEMALGWSTYNGDHMSMYSINCSVPKTLVKGLVRYYAEICQNDELTGTLLDILDTPVSPELVPSEEGEISQLTEEILGEYELHDFFLYYMIRCGFDPSKTLRVAKLAFKEKYSEDHIKKILLIFIKRFFNQQFKRSCTPDGVKLGTVSLSPRGDWCMPSDASSDSWISFL